MAHIQNETRVTGGSNRIAAIDLNEITYPADNTKDSDQEEIKLDQVSSCMIILYIYYI